MRRLAQGFTLVELIVVMVLVGVLAAIGVPRLMGDNGMAAAAFGEEVAGALRTAQKTAVARRRLVCASIGPTEVTLSMAAKPGDACGIVLDGERYATTARGVTASTHTLYFQPNGLITSSAGVRDTTSGSVIVSLDGKPWRSIRYTGSTGHVE